MNTMTVQQEASKIMQEADSAMLIFLNLLGIFVQGKNALLSGLNQRPVFNAKNAMAAVEAMKISLKDCQYESFTDLNANSVYHRFWIEDKGLVQIQVSKMHPTMPQPIWVTPMQTLTFKDKI